MPRPTLKLHLLLSAIAFIKLSFSMNVLESFQFVIVFDCRSSLVSGTITISTFEFDFFLFIMEFSVTITWYNKKLSFM